MFGFANVKRINEYDWITFPDEMDWLEGKVNVPIWDNPTKSSEHLNCCCPSWLVDKSEIVISATPKVVYEIVEDFSKYFFYLPKTKKNQLLKTARPRL